MVNIEREPSHKAPRLKTILLMLHSFVNAVIVRYFMMTRLLNITMKYLIFIPCYYVLPKKSSETVVMIYSTFSKILSFILEYVTPLLTAGLFTFVLLFKFSGMTVIYAFIPMIAGKNIFSLFLW